MQFKNIIQMFRVPSVQLPPKVISYKTAAHYHNQDLDTDLVNIEHFHHHKARLFLESRFPPE